MKRPPHIARTNPLERRHFMRGAGGVFLGLPLLDAMVPAFAATPGTSASNTSESPNRFVAICAGLGFHAPCLFPATEGKSFELTPYLSKLKGQRNQLTILSGLSHPEQNGNNGHASELTWLTSAKRPGLAGFKNTISLDQLIAQKIGIETRFPYLALSNSSSSLSWTANGVEIPAQDKPSQLFKAMFINGTPREIQAEVQRFRTGRSILDTVLGEARRLEKNLGHRDREKLEEYLSSIRALEQRLQQSEGWATKPKPATDATPPTDIEDRNDAINKQKLMYEMMVLALQSDSTRTITYRLGGLNAVPSNLAGVSTDWHNLSHHGRDEAKISELKLIEEAEFAAFGNFLSKLSEVKEGEKSLLDKTSVLFGSNLGNASSHSWKNLPIIVAGGGYRHGGYVPHDEKQNTPLANLFVQLGQRMGLEINQFGSSTGASVKGLA